MWLHILLSALAFNVAFVFPDCVGFLILFSPLPLVILLGTKPGPWVGFKAGWWWGVCVFGVHFTWLLELLLVHSKASWLLSGMIYLAVVTYFALSSACWLLLALGFGSILVFIMTSIGFWLCIEHWIFMLPGLGTGYPFLNPCIPLSSYTTFLKLISCVSILTCPVNIVYVAPVINRIKNTTAVWRTNPNAVGHKVYHQLCKHQDVSPQSFYVAPETMFPFPLNHYPEVVDLWCGAMPCASHFFVGSILEERGKLYQAVFWLQQSPIINVYVKKILTPFVEKIPDMWKDIKILRNFFLAGCQDFCDDTKYTVHGDTDFFDVTPRLRVVPRICLEFFFQRSDEFEQYKDHSKKTIILFFANDSWFNNFFRTILYRLLVIKAHRIGLPVVYVGHFGCKTL